MIRPYTSVVLRSFMTGDSKVTPGVAQPMRPSCVWPLLYAGSTSQGLRDPEPPLTLTIGETRCARAGLGLEPPRTSA